MIELRLELDAALIRDLLDYADLNGLSPTDAVLHMMRQSLVKSDSTKTLSEETRDSYIGKMLAYTPSLRQELQCSAIFQRATGIEWKDLNANDRKSLGRQFRKAVLGGSATWSPLTGRTQNGHALYEHRKTNTDLPS